MARLVSLAPHVAMAIDRTRQLIRMRGHATNWRLWPR